MKAATLIVVSVGGVCGSLARYGIGVLMPHHNGSWAWSMLLVNATGCFFIGVLMGFLEIKQPRQILIRPFLGVGVLGGYTTFSTTVVDTQQLFNSGNIDLGLVYFIGTVLIALLAVSAAYGGTSAFLRRKMAS